MKKNSFMEALIIISPVIIFFILIPFYLKGKLIPEKERHNINITRMNLGEEQLNLSLKVDSICGGGYTDKYGITWDWHGFNGDCFYLPRICFECCGDGTGDPPQEISKKIVDYYKGLIENIEPEYNWVCNSP